MKKISYIKDLELTLFENILIIFFPFRYRIRHISSFLFENNLYSEVNKKLDKFRYTIVIISFISGFILSSIVIILVKDIFLSLFTFIYSYFILYAIILMNYIIIAQIIVYKKYIPSKNSLENKEKVIKEWKNIVIISLQFTLVIVSYLYIFNPTKTQEIYNLNYFLQYFGLVYFGIFWIFIILYSILDILDIRTVIKQ